MERLTILWQQKHQSKPKPSSVWFAQNPFGFETKFFLDFTYFWGQIPIKLAEISTDLQRKPFFGFHLLLGKDHRNTSRSEHRFCATNLQLFGM